MLRWLTDCYNTSISTEDSLRVKSFCLDPLQFYVDVDNHYDMYHMSSWYGCIIMQGIRTPSKKKEPPQIRGEPLSQFLWCFSHFVCEAEADNDGDEDNWDAMQS